MKAATYLGLLAADFLAAVVVAINFGAGIDNYAYDLWFRIYNPPQWKPQSAILAIDDRTLDAFGDIHQIRKPLAEALSADGYAASAGPAPAIGPARAVGEQICLSTITDSWQPAPWFPPREETPWTHGGPPPQYVPHDADASEAWS